MAKRYEHVEQGAEFLDPANVGSSIRWNVTWTEKPDELEHADALEANIYLTDCSRTISWTAYGLASMENELRKIEAARRQLAAAAAAIRRVRREYIAAHKTRGLSLED